MFDVTKEKPITLEAARDLDVFPRRPAFTTLVRWARHGHKGVKLETVTVGRATCTSVPAIQRFIERLSGVPAGKRTPSEATVAAVAAEKYLDAIGIR